MKIEKTSNYKVVVEPRSLHLSDDSMDLDTCKNIVADINRHVDDFRSVEIKCDTEEVCEFCGQEWEVNEDADDKDWELGEPVCCDKAQDEFKLNKI